MSMLNEWNVHVLLHFAGSKIEIFGIEWWKWFCPTPKRRTHGERCKVKRFITGSCKIEATRWYSFMKRIYDNIYAKFEIYISYSYLELFLDRFNCHRNYHVTSNNNSSDIFPSHRQFASGKRTFKWEINRSPLSTKSGCLWLPNYPLSAASNEAADICQRQISGIRRTFSAASSSSSSPRRLTTPSRIERHQYKYFLHLPRLITTGFYLSRGRPAHISGGKKESGKMVRDSATWKSRDFELGNWWENWHVLQVINLT